MASPVLNIPGLDTPAGAHLLLSTIFLFSLGSLFVVQLGNPHVDEDQRLPEDYFPVLDS